MRSLFIVLAALLCVSLAFGQRKVSKQTHWEGTVYAFGKVRGPDGQMHSINGLQLPCVMDVEKPDKMRLMRPISLKKHSGSSGLSPLSLQPAAPKDLRSYIDSLIDPRLMASLNPAALTMFDQTVYRAETGPNGTYGMVNPDAFSDPTSLDDHVMSGGAGNAWKLLTFGVHISTSRVFVCRWIIYDNYLGDQGHDVSAFSSVVADFGVILATDPGLLASNYTHPYDADAPPPNATFHYFQIDVAEAGISCPDNSIYMASQFRQREAGFWWLEDGEGPFDTDQFNVYNIAVPPSTGSSENNFWFDWDPENGIYAQDEMEVLGDEGGAPTDFSNLLRAITTSGTVENVNPGIMDVFGASVTGSIFDVYDSDNSYVEFKPRYDVARGDPNGIVTVEGVSNNVNLTGLRFNFEAAASLPDGTQKIDLFNYTSNAWDTVDTRAITSTDQVGSVFISSNLSRYISSTKHIKARIKFYPPSVIDRSYKMRVDRLTWTLNHP